MLKLPRIYCTKFIVEDLSGGEILKKIGVLDKRKQIDILIIDDDEFTVGPKLEANNFRLTYKKDVTNIKDVSEYQIVLCDIRGVGLELNSQYEGAFLIKEIKRNYPTKQVVAYTGSNYDAAYNDFLQYADEIVKKGMSAEEWIDILDEEIDKCINPIYQWKKVRAKLLEKGVSLPEVAKLESAYVDAVKRGNFEGFEKLANQMSPQGSGFIKELLSSAAISFILKGVGL